MLRGDPPWPKPRAEREARAEVTPAPPRGSKTWALGVLGVAAGASADEVKRAFRAVALRTHPDRGGDEAAFIDARRAYEVALEAVGRKRRRA